MNIDTTMRRGVVAVVTTAAFFAVAACGTEVAPPAQDIGSVAKKKSQAPRPAPVRTSEVRMDFGDDNGTATPRAPRAKDYWKGSGNRMDFRDEW